MCQNHDMKVYSHWAREKVSVETSGWVRRTFEVEVCGGSDRSLEDAREQARRTGTRVRDAIAAGRAARYAYSDRPLREELLEEVRDGRELLAVVTRNGYGARVLNAAQAMFIDIDMAGSRNLATGRLPGVNPWFEPAPETSGKPLWTRITHALGAGRRERREAAFQAALGHIEATAREVPRLGLRVYRTFAGYRCLVTSRTFDPKDRDSRALLERFRSDPLYVKLCDAQECYRARLSPKYWRCGAARPPLRFPFRDDTEEERYRRWERRYEESASGYATCRLVATFGSDAIAPAIRPIVELHDRAACGGSEQLA